MDAQSFLGKVKTHGTRVELSEGVEVLVRCVSVAEARRITKLQQDNKGEITPETFDAMVDVFLECARDPETGDRIFGKEDRETVNSEVPQDIVSKVVQVAIGQDPKAAAKNSERTAA